MTIRIRDKEYCLDGYVTEIQKVIFDAYHQGLADGINKGKADAIKIDLDIPQHFTKEQSEWIKKYCIKRNIEFYNQALEDFRKGINDFLSDSEDFADFVVTDNAIDCVIDELKK